jgi:hypothetical protein
VSVTRIKATFPTDTGLPRGLSLADNEAGWRSSLAKLAALVEGSTATAG